MSRSRLLPKAFRTGWGALRKSAVEADEKPKKTGMLAEISGGKGSRFQNFPSLSLALRRTQRELGLTGSGSPFCAGPSQLGHGPARTGSGTRKATDGPAAEHVFCPAAAERPSPFAAWQDQVEDCNDCQRHQRDEDKTFGLRNVFKRHFLSPLGQQIPSPT
jgi:hypothetical protein